MKRWGTVGGEMARKRRGLSEEELEREEDEDGNCEGGQAVNPPNLGGEKLENRKKESYHISEKEKDYFFNIEKTRNIRQNDKKKKTEG